jgi:hypothetical protein
MTRPGHRLGRMSFVTRSCPCSPLRFARRRRFSPAVAAVQAASRQNRPSVVLPVARQGGERFVAVRLGREMG